MTTTEDPYVQVDRSALRVGMRFDYRGDGDRFDGITRTLTGFDPIAYDTDSPIVQSVTLRPEDTEGRDFYVHRDDIAAPAETAPEAASSEDTEQHDPIETMAERGVRLADEAYQKGVRDGYVKAQQECGTEQATGMADRPAFRREDAVVLAIQALGGTSEASHALIPLAKDIERYVNGSDERQAQAEFPSIIETAEQAALPWPEGTTVIDKDGDPWERGDDSGYQPDKRDGWLYDGLAEGYCRLDAYLPATVTRFGAGA